jgi:DNA-binding beta-propeller fold protein YncE
MNRASTLVLLAALAACPPAAMLGGKDCASDGGCPDGLVCVGSSCWEECSPQALSVDCTTGVGACARSTQFTCADGKRVCSAQVGAPSGEVCNGADDDCDGFIDDLFDAGAACTGGLGVCAGPGLTACVDGGWVCVSNGPQATPEKCNGLDDDCDGFVDDGCLSTIAGSGPPGYLDGPWSEAMFDRPQGLAVDSAGNVYLADSSNNRVRVIWVDGGVGTLAGNGACALVDGPALGASFCQPLSVEVTRSGDLVYVADARNRRVRVVKTRGAPPTVATLNIDAGFVFPRGVHLTPDGGLLVTDQPLNRVLLVNPFDGGVRMTIGSGTAGTTEGFAPNIQLSSPMDALMTDEAIYITESGSQHVRKLPLDGGVSSVLAGGAAGNADGVGPAAQFLGLNQLQLDRDGGRLLVCESTNGQVRAVPLDGSSTATLATRMSPAGLVQLEGDQLAVAEFTHWVRRVALPDDGGAGVISGFVSVSLSQAYTNGAALVARLDDPDRMVAWRGAGLAWVENRTVRWMYLDAGEVITLVGPPPVPGPPYSDGQPGVSGFIGRPIDLKPGPDGGLYVTDMDTQTVRVLDSDASYLGTYAGPNATVNATFTRPVLLAFSRASGHDYLFVVDGSGTQQLRRFDVQAKTQARLATGLDGSIVAPSALAGGDEGEVYLVDNDAFVRRFDLDGGVSEAFRVGLGSGVRGLVFDPQGDIVYGQGRRVMRAYRDAGTEIVYESAVYPDTTTIPGLADGPPRVGILWNASTVVLEGEQLFVADQFNNRIRLLKMPHP